jgi:phosphatidylglycerophosphate synthase
VIDLACSLGLLALLLAAAGAYAIRKSLAGSARNARVEKAGSSIFLNKGTMEMAYWALTPIARACVRIGLTANGVTFLALLLGAGAGVALGFGRFGLAAVLTAASSFGDALDGIVARETGTSSDAGEVFDAAADRYEEFFFLAGLGFYFRNAPLSLGLVLLTVLGSFMVSYGTAKAEALQVESPRGSMRRAERALYLGAGALLAPIAYALTVRFALPSWAPEAPILAALSVVGMVSNVSAVTRLQAVAAAVRRREGAAEASPLPTPGVDPEVDAIRSTAR